jgi:hypothetical protein
LVNRTSPRSPSRTAPIAITRPRGYAGGEVE